MKVWRICKKKHQNTAFSGEGGLYAAGRWHPKGFRIIYTASSLALATLEIFVHTESDKIPLVAIQTFIPDDIVMEDLKFSLDPPMQFKFDKRMWKSL